MATIKLDANFIREMEADVTESKILKRNMWNPDKSKPGAWREDLLHLVKKMLR